jgi:hypothetical protein
MNPLAQHTRYHENWIVRSGGCFAARRAEAGAVANRLTSTTNRKGDLGDHWARGDAHRVPAQTGCPVRDRRLGRCRNSGSTSEGGSSRGSAEGEGPAFAEGVVYSGLPSSLRAYTWTPSGSVFGTAFSVRTLVPPSWSWLGSDANSCLLLVGRSSDGKLVTMKAARNV